MKDSAELRWFEVVREVLGAAHLWQPDSLAETVDAAVSRLGMRSTIWLVDYEQTALRALPRPARVTPEPVPVDGSLPGRAFTRVESTPSGGDDQRWWVPMVDGTDRIGVMEFVVADGVSPAVRAGRRAGRASGRDDLRTR
jgi:sigma-B regulation protein RsbU (phosphoserine phosphatase)